MNEYEAYTVVTGQRRQSSACGITYRKIGGTNTEWKTAQKGSQRIGTTPIRAAIKAIELAVESAPAGSKLSVYTSLNWLPDVINLRKIRKLNSDAYQSLYSTSEKREITLIVFFYDKDRIDRELRIALDHLQEKLRRMAEETPIELQNS